MKLAVLGLLIVVLGWIAGVNGLLYAGGWCVVGGMLVWATIARLGKGSGSAAIRTLLEKRGGLLLMTLLILTLGFPTLTIGILSIGFEPGEEAWRWLPICIGTLMLGVGLAGALGAGVTAVAGIDVIENGLPAELTIESLRDTGELVNKRPKLELDLLVEAQGREAYRVKKRKVVPFDVLGNVEPGRKFEGRVDADRPHALEIDWSRPIPESVSAADPAARLQRLEQLRGDGLITAEEYEAQRKKIVESV